MEGLIQVISNAGPLGLLGLAAFVLLAIGVIKAAGSKNNMPGGGSGTTGTGTGGTSTPTQTPTQTPTNTTQNQ